QHRDQQNPRARGHKRGMEEAGRGDDVDEARRIRYLCAIRDRQMGQTHQSQRHKARMNAVIRRERGDPRVNKPISPAAVIRGEEHWTEKGSDVRLFLWNKHAGDPSGPAGRILFVHGSSMAAQRAFAVRGRGRADSSVMVFFARRGYDTWCVDMEGYGRSTKTRDNNAPIAYGADDCFAAATYIEKMRGKRPLLV